jgi:ppGpp synthetase/RelA/SpoT-type nucleotidyltranferase
VAEELKPSVTPEEWGARYAADRERHEAYANKARDLLLELLDRAGIDAEVVEARTKTVDSFVNKLQDEGQRRYRDPISEMRDLVGLRIVTYIVGDAIKVGEVLEKNFEILWERSPIASGDNGDHDRFGYVSDQYEVRLNGKRAVLDEWAAFADLAAEVQVRTVLQHAWAAISHKLEYKAEREAPRKLRRQLSRISALLEVADKEFSELTEAAARLDADYVAALETGNFDIEINADSLAAFLKVTQRHMHYSKVAEEVGYARFGEMVDERAADWSLANFHAFVDLVLYGSDVMEQPTLADLDQLVPEPAPDYLRSGLREIFEETERGFLPTALPIPMLSLGYTVALRGYLEPDVVMLMLNLPVGLGVGLESVLYEFDEADE